MPDMCIEYEEMKRKAEAYDKLDRDSSSTSDVPVPNKRTDGVSISSESLNAAYEAAADELVEELKYSKETKSVDPYVQKAATRKGRPPKVKV